MSNPEQVNPDDFQDPKTGHTLNPYTQKAKAVQARKRRLAIEQDLLMGVSNQKILAARHGVSQATVSKDIKRIEDDWLERDRVATREGRARRIAQFDFIYQKAVADYELSAILPAVCDDDCPEGCDGGEDCPAKPRRQPGEVKYLKAASEALKEAAKLEALYPRPGSQGAQQTINLRAGNEVHVHSGDLQSGDIENPYLSASGEDICKALAALRTIQDKLPNNPEALAALPSSPADTILDGEME